MGAGEQLRQAMKGERIGTPVYAVYDAFLGVKGVDWAGLCRAGLGVIRHVAGIGVEYPNLEIRETKVEEGDRIRREVCWETPIGELKESYLQDRNNPLLPWKMEYLIKDGRDYRIMERALRDGRFRTEALRPLFAEPEGMGIPEEAWFPMLSLDRTPFQKLLIDHVGLERFAFDLAEEDPGLFALLELMNDQLVSRCALAARESPADELKLWENMSIEVMGPRVYREHLAPVYLRIGEVLEGSGSRLHVHYDGKTRLIGEDIGKLPIFGIDSFTSEPEGDLGVEEARRLWPDKFLWIHPSLSLFDRRLGRMESFVREAAKGAGERLFAFLISEDVPPAAAEGIPRVLELILSLG